MDDPGIVLIIGPLLLFFLFSAFVMYMVPIPSWIAAKTSGASEITLTSLIAMRFRRIPPSVIVDNLIMAVQAGLNLRRADLESHYLADGRVGALVKALIAAQKARIELSYEQAAGIDLAGRNILEAVRMSVEPAVIDCPGAGSGRSTIDAVAKDGIQLKARARVTVRANLGRLIGGATEETIIARVGEGIVTTIGSADSHKAVLENPDMISRNVLSKGLDSGTAFEILSIDIADIDVGENIGATLQIDQANADKQIAQAKAEERRAMAVAREQEMKALEQEMQAKVVEARAQVPIALSDALRSGNLGVMDYYNMQNIQADTSMRQGIADTDKDDE